MFFQKVLKSYFVFVLPNVRTKGRSSSKTLVKRSVNECKFFVLEVFSPNFVVEKYYRYAVYAGFSISVTSNFSN